MGVKAKYIFGLAPEELARIQEEYEDLGYHTTLTGDELVVHVLPPQKQHVKKTDEDEDDKTKRVPKRERKYGYTRASEDNA